jgi:Omp85 superfamily domain
MRAGLLAGALLLWLYPTSLLAAQTASVPAGVEVERVSWQLFPIPMYTTVPTEGSTVGAMPVFLGVGGDGAVQSILAPSVSWNAAAGVTTTLRYYRFWDQVRSASLIAAFATNINRTLRLIYDDLTPQPGRATLEVLAMVRRNLFFRFFGFGPDSSPDDESSYTRTTALASVRWGWNVATHLNLGARFVVRRDWVEEYAIFELPTVQSEHPGTPGLDGAGQVSPILSVRYDTRDGGDYATQGVAIEIAGGHIQSLRGFDPFWQLTGQARALVRETARLQGAARLYLAQQFGGPDVPFYYRTLLGGETLFRGFPEDRFVDRGAWEVEFEQRFRLFSTRIFGVTTDWRLDPFVAAGQVFHQPSQALSRVRLVAGLGLRGWVRPNVLGRVDVGYSGEGLRAYVVLGYPY